MVNERILEMPKDADIPKGDRATATRVWNWMVEHHGTFDNATALAEMAAHEACVEDHDDWLDDEHHWVWDLAIAFYETGTFASGA